MSSLVESTTWTRRRQKSLINKYLYFNSSFPFISVICHEIIEHDDSNTLEELLTHDSCVNEMRGELNRTVLHYSARWNSTSCIRVLLRFAPHLLDAVNKDKYTPLMIDVLNDYRDAAKMLLRAGADVRPYSILSQIVFDIVRDEGNKEMLEILEQHQQVSGIF